MRQAGIETHIAAKTERNVGRVQLSAFNLQLSDVSLIDSEVGAPAASHTHRLLVKKETASELANLQIREAVPTG